MDLRGTLGVTQEGLAKVLGCHVNTVCKMESSKSTGIRVKTRMALVEAAMGLGRMDLVEIFGRVRWE